jgi:hypothetical protein
MEIPDTLMIYIKSELERIRYGKVTISISENTNKIDVATEETQRFRSEKRNEDKYY